MKRHLILIIVVSFYLELAAAVSFLEQPDKWGNKIPDFSFVGYRDSNEPIPNVPARKVLCPCNGDSCADDTERIQAAINEVSKLQLQPITSGSNIQMRGALVLRQGTYRVKGTLKIEASGIVVRGEGVNKTIIVATGTAQRSLFQIGSAATKRPARPPSSEKIPILDDYVPVGSKTFKFDASNPLAKFKKGDVISIVRPASAEWIREIGMTCDNSERPNPTSGCWGYEGYWWSFKRTIVAMTGNSITVDLPFYMNLDKRFGGGYISPGNQTGEGSLPTDIGLENLFLVSEFKKGEEKTDEDHATTGVEFLGVQHTWAADITAKHFVHGFHVQSEAESVTIQDCQHLQPASPIAGGRRYGFTVNGQRVLVNRGFVTDARHDFATSSRVQGPNVFFDSSGTLSHSDIGPHHRWAFGILYDSVTAQEVNCQNRGQMGSGQGWSGAFHVYWNCKATKGGSFQSPPFATNWVIGFQGKKITPFFSRDLVGTTNQDLNNATFYSDQRPATPKSLFLFQLEARSGKKALDIVLSRRKYVEEKMECSASSASPVKSDLPTTRSREATMAKPISNGPARTVAASLRMPNNK